MDGVRIDLVFQGNKPIVSLPGVMQKSEGSSVMLIAEDTPLLRAKLVELLLANPNTQIAVSPCFLARATDFRNPHELVLLAFEGVGPPPLSFNMKDAARRLGISYSKIRRLVRLGRIKRVQGRVNSAELSRYLKEPRMK